jgi:hypothetical protein
VRWIVASTLLFFVGCASSNDYINHPPDYVVRTSRDSAGVTRVWAIVTAVAGSILTIAGSVVVAQGFADEKADCASPGFLCDLNGEFEKDLGGLVLGTGLAHLVAAVILAATASYQAAY